MLCGKPFRRGVQEFGCGQCMPCRINRRRLWTMRLVLESFQHETSFFLTLTYADEYLPPDGSVVPRHLQLFLKRLRFALSPVRIRFFGVGEYGDISARPHYHVMVFGFPARDVVFRFDEQRKRHAWHSALLSHAWPFGIVDIQEFNASTAAYVAGYTVKKLTKLGDPQLGGRHPEFARMSLRPGIGADATPRISDFLTTREGARYLTAHGQVPLTVRHDGKFWPIGRYLLDRVRAEIGMVKSVLKVRGASPLNTSMLEFRLRMQDKDFRKAREGKRAAGVGKAEFLSRSAISKRRL